MAQLRKRKIELYKQGADDPYFSGWAYRRQLRGREESEDNLTTFSSLTIYSGIYRNSGIESGDILRDVWEGENYKIAEKPTGERKLEAAVQWIGT